VSDEDVVEVLSVAVMLVDLILPVSTINLESEFGMESNLDLSGGYITAIKPQACDFSFQKISTTSFPSFSILEAVMFSWI
jgi:hypothetical protein